jgi:hypothetical protein
MIAISSAVSRIRLKTLAIKGWRQIETVTSGISQLSKDYS